MAAFAWSTGAVLILSAAIGIAVGLLTGLAPALRATDPNLTGH
jgi:hypothetical protein